MPGFLIKLIKWTQEREGRGLEKNPFNSFSNPGPLRESVLVFLGTNTPGSQVLD